MTAPPDLDRDGRFVVAPGLPPESPMLTPEPTPAKPAFRVTPQNAATVNGLILAASVHLATARTLEAEAALALGAATEARHRHRQARGELHELLGIERP